MTTGTTLRGRLGLPAWTAPAATGAVALAAGITVALVDPNEPGRYPLCPFRLATGLDCPGCGGLRAVHALTRGDVVTALDHNVLALVLLPLLAWGWLGWLTARRTGGDPPQLSGTAGYAVLGAILVFWVVRNLPVSPLAWLASGAS